MNKDYAIPTAQDFKTVGKRLLKDYEQNISNISKELDKELYSFPDMVIDNYIAKCVKTRQNVFDTTLKAHHALQWLVEQQGFIKSFGGTLDNYLKEITKEQVTKLFTQDIQNYYKLFQNLSDATLDMDIYQLQQKYEEKTITYTPYQEGCYTNGDYEGFANHFQDKQIFELISNLCIFYGNWLDGLYKRKAEYIKSDLNNLKKNLKNIHSIINKPDFIDCFPKNLLSNILPSSDIKQNYIEKNSINYLENLIEQHEKVGLRKDDHLERRLKIQDLARIVVKFYPRDQLIGDTKLEHIVYEMMTIPVVNIGSVEEALTPKSVRDSLEKLDIIFKQNIEHLSPYADSYEEYDNYIKDYVKTYDNDKDYIRNNPEEE